MSQAALIIPNGSGASVRANMNGAFDRLATRASGTGRPPDIAQFEEWTEVDNPGNGIVSVWQWDGVQDILKDVIDTTVHSAEPQGVVIPPGVPAGTLAATAAVEAPDLWLFCDGATLTRVEYPELWAALHKEQAGITIASGTPAIITWMNHKLMAGSALAIYTTGTLPSGLTPGTVYYVLNPGTNTFQLSATPGGAAINTTGTQTGSHTGVHAPHGVGDGVNTFTIPDYRGRTFAGSDAMGGGASANRLGTGKTGGFAGPAAPGLAGGEQTHTLTQGEQASMTTSPVYVGTSGAQFSYHPEGFGGAGLWDQGGHWSYDGQGGGITVPALTAAGGGQGHNNVQPTLTTPIIIFTGKSLE